MGNLLDTIATLHKAYCARTGLEVVYNMHRENVWREWLAWSGFTWTEAELALVIAYLRHGINHRERNEGALRFHNLIGDPARFEEDLAFARKWRRSDPSRPRRQAKPEPVEVIDEAQAETLRAELKERLKHL